MTWRTGIGSSRWQGVGDFNNDGISDIALQIGADIDVLLGNYGQFEYTGHWRGGMVTSVGAWSAISIATASMTSLFSRPRTSMCCSAT